MSRPAARGRAVLVRRRQGGWGCKAGAERIENLEGRVMAGSGDCGAAASQEKPSPPPQDDAERALGGRTVLSAVLAVPAESSDALREAMFDTAR